MKVCHAIAELEDTVCPMSFSVREIRDSYGNGIREGGPWPCVGPKCMAWRFSRTHISDPTGGLELVPSDSTHGYCGLAGSTTKDTE